MWKSNPIYEIIIGLLLCNSARGVRKRTLTVGEVGMINYSLGALVSLALFFLGGIALVVGHQNFINNKSKAGRHMFFACICVFLWDAGYSWMGLCYNTDFAYVPRAIALLSISGYMSAILLYVTELSGINVLPTKIFLSINVTAYLVAWVFIIQKDAVSFRVTPWGYWYTSDMSWARVLQFASVIATLVVFYIDLSSWKKSVYLKRDEALIKRFKWFGIIMMLGYLLDTLFPIMLHTTAIPGSSIAAFVSALVLYGISRKYRSFGISVNIVADFVFNEVKVPVLVLDMIGRITLFNEEAKEFFDKPNNELYGLILDDLVEKVPLGVEDTAIDEDSTKIINAIYKLKNKEAFCRIDESVMRDDFGEVQCSIIFAADMTAARDAMVNLSKARRMAEEANVAKSNFLANMSHEIRTPMNAIIGMSDILLRDNKLDKDAYDHLVNIKDAGNGLLGIINDILDLSKIESGKYELIEDDYEVAGLINDVTTMIKVKFNESPVKFIVSVSPNVPARVYGDELRVRQILMNILGNAVKFTKKGYVALVVKSERDDNGYTLSFDIKDSGIGIKPEQLDAIFGAFNQVDTRKNRNIQGTGLGLAISKNLAQIMGGDILVESTYGEGSIFKVRIRQGIVGDEVLGSEIATALNKFEYHHIEAGDNYVMVPRPGKKVLIVDDTNVNLIVAKGLLKPYEMEVDTASSGSEALRMVQEKAYDLVFMDHMMPDMDGVDTTKNIRALEDEKFKKLTIVALTANAVSGTKEMLVSEGMQDFLAKPIEKRELNEILDKWL